MKAVKIIARDNICPQEHLFLFSLCSSGKIKKKEGSYPHKKYETQSTC